MTKIQIVEQFFIDIKKEYNTGRANEHTYRPAIKALIEGINSNLHAINEPKKSDFGAPDFIIQNSKYEVQIGHLEAKDITVKLDDPRNKEQLERYKASLNNLCYTNNLEWQFFKNKYLCSTIRIGDITNGKIIEDKTQFITFINHIEEFLTQRTVTITSAKELAEMMAKKAILLKDIIFNILENDKDNSINSELIKNFQIFQKELIRDLDFSSFSDIYAQTITYGFFTARYYDEDLEDFTRHEAVKNLPNSNPFLKNIFDGIAGNRLDDRLEWVVDNIVEMFAHTNVKELFDKYGTTTNMTDPVLHFYESFLGAYDPEVKKKMGVYYTPESVVKFIVKSVDEILINDFGLPMGLADNSKIKVDITDKVKENPNQYDYTSNGSDIIVEMNGQKINKDTKFYKEYFRTQILDPATGTGTFMLETFRQINGKFQNQQGQWPQYVENNLIPRVHGFELMMASYTMAHLKLAIYLNSTGVKIKNRLSVYLTNTLEAHHTDLSRDQGLFGHALSQESELADKVKSDLPIMVVMGNPPYSVSSDNKSEWILDLIKDYKKNLNERNIQPLSDDYIKFIKYGQHYVEKNGSGIVAYITNNSFIDGIIHREMRSSLLKTFDKIFVMDLHGSAKKKEVCPDGSPDKNVFDIQQGVAIIIMVKNNKKQVGEDAQLLHTDLYGSRKKKFEILNNESINSNIFVKILPESINKFYTPFNFENNKSYQNAFKINEIINIYGSGVETRKDYLTVHFNKLSIQKVIKDILNNTVIDLTKKYNITPSRDWDLELVKKHLIEIGEIDTKYINISYRPLDDRIIYFENKFIAYPFRKVFNNGENNIYLVTERNPNSNWNYAFVSKFIIDKHITGALDYAFPIYTKINIDLNLFGEMNKPIPNLNKESITQIESKIKLQLDWEAGIEVSYSKSQELGKFSPVDLLDYIYSVLHNPDYRSKYKEFLKIDFPRVPFDVTPDQFWSLVAIGSQLRTLHLVEGISLGDLTTNYNISGDNIVNNKIRFIDNQVFINDTQFFGNVSDIAWNFYIGGYQPAQKWLKDRKTRELSNEDINHYQKIIYILNKTDELMKSISELKTLP